MNRQGAKPKANRPRILVVDDAEDARYLLSALLTGSDYMVETAANGQEALAKLRGEEFDLVISDILMPVMDGFQLCREVRRDDRLRRVLFVFYTATYTQKGDETFALQLGADDFILKPAEPEALLMRIKAVIDKANERGWTPRSPELTEEVDVLRLYSERLIAKLEKRTLDVERELAERRKAESALAESEERFRHLFEESPSGIALVDAEGLLQEVNPELLRLLDASREDLVGKSLAELAPGFGLNPKKELADFGQRLAGRPAATELAYLDREGEQRTIAVQDSVVTRDGQPTGVMYLIRDITERKRAEQAVQDSELKYRQVVENASEAIFIVQDGYMRFANAATAKLLARPEEEVTSHPFPEFIHPEDQAMVVARHQRRLAGEEVEVGYEFRFVTGKGDVRWARLNATRVEWQGRPATLNLVGDVTERREAEDKLRRSQEATIRSVGAITERRDPYTAGHQERVAVLSCAIANEMGMASDKIEGLRVATLLHDIGKMSVPAEILSKPTKLTQVELSLVREHPKAAFEILEGIEFPWPIAEIILQHHERLDGSGYPKGLAESEICLEAKILAVADVVEAMASHRPYRPALGIDAALKEIKDHQGKLYDSEVAEACIQLFADGFEFTPVGAHPSP